MADVIEVTDDSVMDFVLDNNLAVVDCWAPWCGPCRMLGPVLEELAGEYEGKISFGKLNVDDNKKIAAEHGVMSIPTLLIFKDGKVAEKITGALPKQMLEPKLIAHL